MIKFNNNINSIKFNGKFIIAVYFGENKIWNFNNV